MATSGIIRREFTDWDWMVFEWELLSQDEDKLTSTIEWTLTLESGSSGRIISTAPKECKIEINGTTFKDIVDIGIGANTKKILATGSSLIYHKSDGTKRFMYSFYVELGLTFSGEKISSVSGNGYADLPVIAPYPSISFAPSFTDEDVNKSLDFTYSMHSAYSNVLLEVMTKTSIGGWSTAFNRTDVKANASKYTLTITDTEMSILRSRVASGVAVTIAYKLSGTINGVIRADLKEAVFTLADAAPTLNPTVEDTNSVTVALTGDKNVLIKYASSATFTTGAVAKAGATIRSQSCNNGFEKIIAASGTFEATQGGTFKFIAVDTRGAQTNKTVTKTLINYFKPTCTVEAETPGATDTSFNFTVSGSWFNGSFGAKSNSITLQYRYTESGGSYSSWTSLTATKSGNTYTANGTISGIDYKKTYTIQARVTDKLYTVKSYDNQTVIEPVFDWSKDDFNFNVPVTIQGNPIADMVIEQGDDGSYAYRKWASGLMEAWRTSFSSVEVAAETTYGSMFYKDGLTVTTTGQAAQFTHVDSVQLSFCKTGSGLWYPLQKAWYLENGAVTIYYLAINPTKLTANVVPSVYIIGRWK